VRRKKSAVGRKYKKQIEWVDRERKKEKGRPFYLKRKGSRKKSRKKRKKKVS